MRLNVGARRTSPKSAQLCRSDTWLNGPMFASGGLSSHLHLPQVLTRFSGGLRHAGLRRWTGASRCNYREHDRCSWCHRGDVRRRSRDRGTNEVRSDSSFALLAESLAESLPSGAFSISRDRRYDELADAQNRADLPEADRQLRRRANGSPVRHSADRRPAHPHERPWGPAEDLLAAIQRGSRAMWFIGRRGRRHTCWPRGNKPAHGRCTFANWDGSIVPIDLRPKFYMGSPSATPEDRPRGDMKNGMVIDLDTRPRPINRRLQWCRIY